MARESRQDLEQAVLDVLPQDGSPMLYEQAVTQLRQTGFHGSIPLIRNMKKRGLVSMAVRLNDAGELVHEIKKEG